MNITQQYEQITNRIITGTKVSSMEYDTCEVLALWDTGAMKSVITKKIAEKLKLVPIDEMTMIGVTGEAKVNVYAVCVVLNDLEIDIQVLECMDMANFDLLIGMDIISQGDFIIANNNEQTIFSFRIPSMGAQLV
jgi:predicted aspartyl protease